MLEPLRRAVNAARAGVAAASTRFGRRTLVWAVVLAVLAGVLDAVPLFDVLGYDFSFALGLAAALAGVDVGAGVVARWRRAQPDAPPTPATPRLLGRLLGEALLVAAATLALPLLLSLGNALRVRNCSLAVGLGFFALLPLATVIVAAPAGVLAALAVRRRGRLVAFAIPIVSLGWALLRLYREPPVFAFDPFGGYFPGPIYDEALRPPAALVWFRLANLVWIGTAIVVALAAWGRGRDPRRWRRWPLLGALPLVALSVALYASGGALGFRITRADLARALDRTITTDHFVLHYAGSAGKSPADLALAAEDLEFRYEQLRHTLGVEPPLPITVWEFPSAEAKKALVGAGNTLYARPWTHEIFMQGDRFPSPLLRHEMAHVFAGVFGDPLFGLALTVRFRGPLPVPVLASGLVEGVAEAATSDDPEGDSTIHEQAAAMIAAGLAPPLAAVVGAGFSTLAGARAYTMAGSFSSFLLQTRGAEPLRRLYKSGGNFIDVYRVPLADLEREWRATLARLPLNDRARARASETFRRPAIFKRVCARELGARVAEARAVMTSDPTRARVLLESTCRDDPDEPTYALALAEAEALSGARAEALTRLGRMEADGETTVPLKARAASLAAEIDFHGGDFANAAVEQRRATDWASTEADRRQGLAKQRALADRGARETLGRTLFGDALGRAGADPVLTFFSAEEFARLHADDPLGPYLVGRQLLARDPARALPYLSRACGDEAPAPTPRRLPVEFLRECRRMTADGAYRTGDFERARAALDRLAADASGEADRLRALDMRARVDWAAARRVGPVAGAP
jgi:hypothetical protein